MAQARRDDNRVPTLLGVDSTLFETPTTAAVDPITHEVLVKPSLPTGAATSAKQLADNHQVTVSNPTTNPETGLAKDATLTGGTAQAKIKETSPIDTTKTNPSLVLTYDGSNQITNIALTIGATTYNKTLTWVAGNCTAVSVWT